MAKLKVYRTSIGFHDAYVAAPSMKAALRAWGSEKDLFARGAAELITDPDLAKEALNDPGVVFKRSRGSAVEQLAALDTVGARKLANASKRAPSERVSPRPPKPDRSAVDAAEKAIADVTQQHQHDRTELDTEMAELRHKIDALFARQEKESAKLEKARAAADASYRRKLERWRR